MIHALKYYTVFTGHAESPGVTVGIVIGVMLLVIIVAIALFIVYGYWNPTSSPGQFMIKVSIV